MVYANIEDVIEDLKRNPVEKKGHLYHPIPFSEFSTLKNSSNEKEASRKLDLIVNTINNYIDKDIKDINLLDIGANAGFYTFSLAKMGAHVTAFEHHARYGPIGSFIAENKNLPVKWFSTKFCRDSLENDNFDITLMLSVFQWMAAGGKFMSRAVNELNYISKISETLIFELGYNKGNSCLKTKKINHYAELINMLQRYTRYNSFKLLGKTKPWGSGKRFIVLCSVNSEWDDSGLARLLRAVNI